MTLKCYYPLNKKFAKTPESKNNCNSNSLLTTKWLKSVIKISHAKRLNEKQTSIFIHFNNNKPVQVRVVFDVLAKDKGRSLDQNLWPGLVLLNNFTSVLTRFHQREFAAMTDIAVMVDNKQKHYQVKIPLSETDALQFLWRYNPLKSRACSIKACFW